MKHLPATRVNTLTWHHGRLEGGFTNVISEQAVMLQVNNDPWLTFMCTPVDLEALGIGFLFNEEIIHSLEDVATVKVCPDGSNIDIWLNSTVARPERWIRTSGCSGGRTSLDGKRSRVARAGSKNGTVLNAEMIGLLIADLLDAQDLYRQSGGVHTSALSDGTQILISTEDIGRHNTLDKLAGRCLLEQINPAQRVILTTGRVSSEMIQKAGRMRAAIIISRTSPSSLSTLIAENLGITLIGYARRNRFTVYTHPERIAGITASQPILHEEK
jgi:FdhD protein